MITATILFRTIRTQFRQPWKIDCLWFGNCSVAHVSSLALIKSISDRILMIRGEKVILDADLPGFMASQQRLNEQEEIAQIAG